MEPTGGTGVARARIIPRGWALAAAGLLASGLAGQPAFAETRGYVVSWFHVATYSQDGDCPDGLNPSADIMFRNILKALGKTQEETDALMVGFPNGKEIRPIVINRGRIDGKPVNIYQNPASEPDPMVKTVKGRYAYGFNLDGKVTPDDFIDPDTQEAGVDNQLYRALGCFHTQRAMPPARPTYPAIQWDTTRDQMPAWLIEINGIEPGREGAKDGDVDIGIYRATGPIARNATGDPQADMNFRIDANPRTQNFIHGTIRNGVITTDTFDFNMIGDPFALTEYHMKEARLRLTLNPDGSLKGLMGGYQPWAPVYVSFAVAGSTNEFNLSVDVPGIYYALKKMADAYPDPATGQNTAISSAFVIEAVPAFIAHPDKNDDKTAEAGRASATAFLH
jgi:hypothetical protein